MNKLENLIDIARLNDLLGKKEEENVAVVGGD